MAVDFFDRNRGYAVGYVASPAGTIRGMGFRTDDGGATWQKISIPGPPLLKWRLYDVVATSKNGVIVVGDLIVAISSDGGRSWGKPSISGGSADDGIHERIYRGIGDTLWIDDEGPHRQVLVSYDLGNTWAMMSMPLPDSRGRIAVLSSNLAFAAVGQVQYATDGGKTWSSVFDMTPANESFLKLEFRAAGRSIVAYGEQYVARCELSVGASQVEGE